MAKEPTKPDTLSDLIATAVTAITFINERAVGPCNNNGDNGPACVGATDVSAATNDNSSNIATSMAVGSATNIYDEALLQVRDIDENTATDDLNPLQVLKVKASNLYSEFYNILADQVRDEVLAEVKDAMKTELRMELFMELQQMVGMVTQSSQLSTPQSSSQQPRPSAFSRGAISLVEDEPEPPRRRKDPSVEELVGARSANERLQVNPLFSRINKNLERIKKGEAAYTPEDIVQIRRTRGINEDEVSQIRKRMDLSTFEYDNEDDTETDKMFDRIFKDKYGG